MSLPLFSEALLRRARLLLVALSVLAGAPLALAAPAQACSRPDDTTMYYRLDRCVGNRDMPARERLNPRCLTRVPTPGELYPTRAYCGGSKRGAEAIAQARAVAWLNRDHTSGGVDAKIQYEVRTLGLRRADIVHNSGSALEVYEVKTNTNPADQWAQVKDYVRHLAGTTPPPVRGWSSLVNLGEDQYFDAFGIKSVEQDCEGAGATQWDIYVVWKMAPGYVHVHQFLDKCFDPHIGGPVLERVLVKNEDGALEELPLQNLPAGPWLEVVPPAGCGVGTSCLPPWAPPRTTVPKPSGSGSYGDPHMATFDGLSYDFMAAGEFQFVLSESLDLDVQIRTTPWGNSGSMIDRIAAAVNGSVVEVDPWQNKLLIDGVDRSQDADTIDLGDGAWVVRDQGGWFVTWPGPTPDARPVLWAKGGSIQMWVPPGTPDVTGLLGNADGDRDNDLRTSDGQQLSPNTGEAELYRAYAASWRLGTGASLLRHALGSTEDDYNLLDHPAQYTRLADLSDATLAEGTSRCEQAQVIDGPQFEDCILDWAITRDQAFVDAAATQSAPVVEAGAHGLDATNALSVDFDGAVPANFSSARYGSAPDTGRFAGPFGRDGRYVFYVPDVARSATTLDLDLIQFGSWSPLEAHPMSVEVDGKAVWQGNPQIDLTASASGVTATGQPYTVYPLHVETPHRAGSLNVGVSADIPLGSTRAFAVDDVRVHGEPTPTQGFDVTLPAGISDGMPYAGAGRFETIASEDDYRFTTQATNDPLLLDFEDCTHPDSLEWSLYDTQTGRVVKDGNLCRDETLGLPAGSYRLEVTGYGHRGTYRLTLSRVPAQRFDVTLPATISDGVPAAGAGRLETMASSDVHSFTMAGDGTLRVAFSDCDAELSTGVVWSITPVAGTRAVANGQGCGAHTATGLVDGTQYTLWVSGHVTGAYRLALAVEPSQRFDVTLPLTASDGLPGAGAGRLENGASSDDYRFTPAQDGPLQIEISGCADALAPTLRWRLVSGDGRFAVARGAGCAVDQTPTVVRDAPYRLVIEDDGGHTGAYTLRLAPSPPEQKFELALPAAVDGELETLTSKDVYTFDLAEKGSLRLDFSACSTGLGWGVNWKLVYETEHRWILSDTYDCVGEVFQDMPAGRYRLEVSKIGAVGTYHLDVGSEPTKDFAVSLPLSVSDGVPGPGAGRLETSASGDGYQFTTPGGKLHVEITDCEGLDLRWRLVWVDRGVVPQYHIGCGSFDTTVENGTWKLVVETEGRSGGTYALSASLGEISPDHFGVDLPASMPQTGVDYIGSGNLETEVSEDVYRFYRWNPGPLRFEFSDCAGGLAAVDYTLTDANGETIASGSTCSTVDVEQYVPEGWYTLSIKRPGRTGTYKVELSAPPPVQTFDVSLPLSVSDGVPMAGAGRAELDQSTDVYRFQLAHAGSLELDVSGMGDWPSLNLNLIDRATGQTVYRRQVHPLWGNPGTLMENVPAGDYDLEVGRIQAGTYHLDVYLAVAPQTFAVTLPFTASDGVPAAGAGRLETTSSIDAYRFAKSSGGPLQIDVSDCATGTHTADWRLINEASGALVEGRWSECAPLTLSWVNAGSYRLEVMLTGAVGTYRLGVSVPPQTFALTLPATVSPNVPKSGAGSLETTASTDVYTFSTPAAGGLQLDFSSCSSGLGGAVDYRLADPAGATVASGSSCATVSLANVPAGALKLFVTRPGKSGTYSLKLVVPPPADTVDVTLPASGLSGNLETTASEDVFRFTTTAAATLQIDLSTCATSLSGGVAWTLVNAATGATVASAAAACGSTAVRDLPAGGYRLSVTRGGKTGTYKLALAAVAAQPFDVTLPASVSNGVPKAGAGNLEYASSEDQYRFTTTAAGSIKLAFSTCSTSLGTVSWKLVNATTGATVASNASSCATTTVPSVPAGSYRLAVNGTAGKVGTYKVVISKV